MCGIAGWFGPDGGMDADALVAALRHRGPDGHGVWEGEAATLVHTRLAILDLSEAGKQPMVFEEKLKCEIGKQKKEDAAQAGVASLDPFQLSTFNSLLLPSVLVFNGEIFNHAELRDELEAQGESFVGHSDTEVLLRLLVIEGEACLSKLAGMFAFAFWDEEKREALLARDAFGIKPLYYREVGDSLGFASETRVLKQADDQTDATALRDFFLWGSVPEPQTLVAEIRQVPAGCLMRWKNGKVSVERWHGVGAGCSDHGLERDAPATFPTSHSHSSSPLRGSKSTIPSQEDPSTNPFLNSSSDPSYHLRSSALICGSTSSTHPLPPHPICGSGSSSETKPVSQNEERRSQSDATTPLSDSCKFVSIRGSENPSSHLRQSASICGSIPLSRAEVIATTRAALEESMRRHLVSDVPVGIFLSGGIDSTVVLALTRQALGPDADIRTFSIGFDDPAFDESSLARRTAEHFGARHTEWKMTPEEGAAEIPAFLAAADQPSVDGFNTWCVSKLARREGMKVVMSGLGGDEFFAGYGSFQRVPRFHQAYRLLGPLRPLLAAVLDKRPVGSPWRRLAAFLRGGGSWLEAFHAQRGIFTAAEAEQLARALTGKASTTPAFSASRSSIHDPQSTICDPRSLISDFEVTRYMRNQLLRDSDVFSMAHGLELRVPLVDVRLAETLLSLPPAERLRQGKQLLLDTVPEIPEWVRNQAKRGFRFPFQQWMEGQFGELLAEAKQVSPVTLNAWYRTWAVAVAMRFVAR